jgi:hypothetical protein
MISLRNLPLIVASIFTLSKLQAARSALSLAKHFNAPLREISSLGLRLMAEKRALHTLKLKKAQQPLLSQASHDGQQPQAAGNMWKLLRSYKTDHAKSNLPQKISSPPRITVSGKKAH